MNKKKPPQKPTNLRNYDCDVVVKGQCDYTKLEINPDYEEKNKEFMEGLKRNRKFNKTR